MRCPPRPQRRSERWGTRASPDACRQFSAPHCLGGKRGERESGKIGIEGEGIQLKASPLVCKVLKHHLRAPVNDAPQPLSRQFTSLSSPFSFASRECSGNKR